VSIDIEIYYVFMGNTGTHTSRLTWTLSLSQFTCSFWMWSSKVDDICILFRVTRV